MKNIVYLAKYPWSAEILKGLINVQKGKEWKITLVIVPENEKMPGFKGIKTIRINPKEISRYADIINAQEPMVIPAYGWNWMIPKEIINIAPCLVLHPSKLPKYRGGTPINNQLLDGVTKSAVSIIYATDKLDGGNILAQEEISFEGYLEEIFQKMANTGLKLSIDLFDRMVKGKIIGKVQDEKKATFVKRRTPAMSEITIDEIKTKSAAYLYNKIRGLQEPYPEAFIVCGDGKKLFITKAHPEE